MRLAALMTNDRMVTGQSSWDYNIQLLIRYLRLSADALSKTLDTAGIEVDAQAKPVFLDDLPIQSNPDDATRSGATSGHRRRNRRERRRPVE
jgi:hypothetical protein